MEPSTLTREILAPHLKTAGFEDLADALAAEDQDHAFRLGDFTEGLSANLMEGRFRLVLVLDSAPDELVRLVGYLETVAPELTIDLVTVAYYDIGDERLLVPQRIDPEHVTEQPASGSRTTTAGFLVEGAEDFMEAANREADEIRIPSRKVYEWAKTLESRGLVRLSSFHGSGVTTLLLRLPDYEGGLVSVWKGKMYLYRSLFETRTPNTIPRVETALGPAKLGQGTVAPAITDELLLALTEAYEEAKQTWSQAPHELSVPEASDS